ncbi:DUF6074 family protein [Rhizobium lusitanum]|uniref:Uncharacterized protein n=1 Tax=Rhizobium lusitanum TaxID=293958 RepID=A0A7X0IQ87_9HYPH|nr:DUF6074 family protein [Rhizobium lusitanum]MBB6483962.1 hypothetical protein [Rhizobium lusitanum]
MSLLAFPADRRTSDIRRCAKALLQLNGEEANRFWRSEMAGFAARLTAQGMDQGEISRQAALFMHAVQMELQLAFAIDDERNASA